MNLESIKLEKSAHISRITLNRPEKLNAFGSRMRQEIVEVLEDAEADTDIRVIIITGAGKAFCAGGDANEILDGSSKALSTEITSQRPAMSQAVLTINKMEKPVIASVNGVAAGGGCNLALACDIRIASDKARFGQVFTRRGLHPDWGGIYLLPRLVGYAKAAELIFSAEIINADDALKIGMVNRVVPHEALYSETNTLAEKIVSNAPLAIAFSKRGLQRFHQWDLEQAVDYEAYVVELLMKSKDVKEGFTAFLEKRDPVFRGK